MLKHRQIEAFRAIVISGSMSAAANMMNITQPAISRLIRDLEHTTRLQLFERTRGRLVPTGDAISLFREVDRSFVGLERLMGLARDLRERRGGSLRVAALPGLANNFLPTFAAGFLAKRSALNLAVFGMNSHFILEWIKTGQCDLGMVEHTQLADYETEDLPPIEMVAVLPSGHKLASRDSVHPEDFEGEEFISLGQPSVMHLHVDAIMRERGIVRRIRIETPLSMIACAMVAAGAGLSVVDPFTAELYASSLAIRRFRPAVFIRWTIVMPGHIKPSTIAREFITEFKTGVGTFLSARADTLSE